MHEVSLVATKQTRVYRANGQPDDLSAETQQWAEEQAEIPAWLRSREGRIALPSTALMVNLEARDLLWAAGNTLSTWARHLAESRDAELPTADTLVAWLLSNVQAARFDEAGAEMHDEITALAGQMRRAVDRLPSRLYAGPCHAVQSDGKRCQRPLYAPFNVWRSDDEDERTIVCDGYRPPADPDANSTDVGCRAETTPIERKDWLLAELDEALLPFEVLAEALPKLLRDDLGLEVPRGVMWSWVRDGRLMAKAPTLDGEELFSGSDMMDLMRAYRPKTYAPRRRRIA